MKIDDAIKYLQDAKREGTKNIIVAWWEADAFNQKDNDDWAYICDVVDSKMDWSYTHDGIQDLIDLVNK